MGLWSPFMTYCIDPREFAHALQRVGFSYAGRAALVFYLECLFHEAVRWSGEPVSFSGFFSGPPSGHLLGLLGGCIWGLAPVCNSRQEN